MCFPVKSVTIKRNKGGINQFSFSIASIYTHVGHSRSMEIPGGSSMRKLTLYLLYLNYPWQDRLFMKLCSELADTEGLLSY